MSIYSGNIYNMASNAAIRFQASGNSSIIPQKEHT